MIGQTNINTYRLSEMIPGYLRSYFLEYCEKRRNKDENIHKSEALK